MQYLDADLLELQSVVRDFSQCEVAPIASKLDLEDERIPGDVMAKMADMGLFGVNLPERYGGSELGATGSCMVTEELAAANLSVGSVIHRNASCGEILHRFGTDEQQERWLRAIATGAVQTASAGTEPNAGSDAANIQTTAVRDGDHYVVNGTKQWCTNADRADLLFTYVRTDRAEKHRGVSLLVIEKPPGEFLPPHLTGTHLPTAGYRGMWSYTLHFDDLRVPSANLVGGIEGQGFKQLMATYEIARTTFAFRCVGLARAAYEAARDYAKERVQFDQPIAAFQAVRFRLAEMATQIEAARALGYATARAYDAGGRVDLQAGMAKLFASEMARRVCWDALYLHGGNGYAIETPVNRYWRDSGLLPIGEGTSDIQREIIARRLLGER
jgi:alkylation response protein AidB-like acyl-CoA dehydrogenase